MFRPEDKVLTAIDESLNPSFTGRAWSGTGSGSSNFEIDPYLLDPAKDGAYEVVYVDSVFPVDPETRGIPSNLYASNIRGKTHFVCVKNTGDIALQAYLNTYVPPQGIDKITWECTGTTITAGADKLTATLSSATPGKFPVTMKIAGNIVFEGVVWVVWAQGQKVADRPLNVRTTTVENGDSTVGQGTAIEGGYNFKFSINPSSIASDADRPALNGGSNVDVPGSGTLHFLSNNDLKGGADLKWDVSRRIRVKIINPSFIAVSSLYSTAGSIWNNQPVAIDTPVDFPADDRIGNDDTHPGDENNNPYQASNTLNNTHAVGEISSTDFPKQLMRDSSGLDGNTFEWRLQFGEFSRILLVDTWFRCSDFFDWRAHFKVKRQSGTWVNDGSTLALDNNGF